MGMFESKGALRYHALWAYTGIAGIALFLDKIPLPANQDAHETVEKINHNIDHLNRILYGFQDYAVIGKKP